MIRILDGKKLTGDREDYKGFIGEEYYDFADFTKAISHKYLITEVGPTVDETIGYIDLQDKILYTEKSILYFEDVNIITSRKYQKYL